MHTEAVFIWSKIQLKQWYWQRWTVMKYIYLSIILEYSFWVSVLYLSLIISYAFNFTAFERQISYFSLHYISIKVLEVQSRYYVAALKVSEWFYLFFFFSKTWLFWQPISNQSSRVTWSNLSNIWPAVSGVMELCTLSASYWEILLLLKKCCAAYYVCVKHDIFFSEIMYVCSHEVSKWC